MLLKSILLMESMKIPVDVISGKTIAFVSNNAWSIYNFRLDVIRWLLSVNAKVLVLSPHDDFAGKLIEEGCHYHPVEFSNKSENPVKDIVFYLRLKRMYSELRPDFIFHFVAKPNIYGSMAAAACNIPCVAVITGLGYPFARKDLLFYIIRFLYRRALRRVREAWFLNNEDAKVFVDEGIINVSRIRVLPGEGVNTDHFKQVDKSIAQAGSFRFLMSTRLLKSKGVGVYADAARILRNKRYEDVEFGLLGFFEKNHPDSIGADELSGWQREGLLSWLGFAADVRPHMSRSHCMVFPSYYNEGVPRCLMEAASMELPGITSMNRGCREVVIDGENGFLAKINDPFDFADKMERMIRLSTDERMRMGRKGRELVIEKFDVRKIIDVYANTLISAFENTHGSNSQHGSAVKDHR